MLKTRIWALVILLIGFAIGFFVFDSQKPNPTMFSKPFVLGLDLSGGTQLIYKADTSNAKSDPSDSMTSLKEVVEKRINLFGVTEPIIETQEVGIGDSREYRLSVELPGVTDIKQATSLIGKTPLLEFKLENPEFDSVSASSTDDLSIAFLDTGFTGEYLKKATLNFSQSSVNPSIGLEFTDEGTKKFAEITEANIGRALAIFLDGTPISVPVIRQSITDGHAEITGTFTPEEAKNLVRDLNYGALPLPIELISTQSIGPTLGEKIMNAGIMSGLVAFIAIGIFLIVWYRLPGVVAVVALLIYTILNLVIFKLIPVTLTAAGIAGFILSMGMAVDANILIFERTKEELKKGRSLYDAVKDGFKRAWTSIRDSNLSSIITAVILFYFASTSVIKGFALVFLIGVLVSMFTAITATRIFLTSIEMKDSKFVRFLFGSGLSK